jgi:hypothetical protein
LWASDRRNAARRRSISAGTDLGFVSVIAAIARTPIDFTREFWQKAGSSGQAFFSEFSQPRPPAISAPCPANRAPSANNAELAVATGDCVARPPIAAEHPVSPLLLAGREEPSSGIDITDAIFRKLGAIRLALRRFGNSP